MVANSSSERNQRKISLVEMLSKSIKGSENIIFFNLEIIYCINLDKMFTQQTEMVSYESQQINSNKGGIVQLLEVCSNHVHDTKT